MDDEYSDPVIIEESKLIEIIKQTGSNVSDTTKLSFNTIDLALQSLRGDVWVSECLLVVTPKKGSIHTSLIYEVHGIDKIYKEFLGTIFLSSKDLATFQADGTFDNYSMMFIKSSIDPRTSLDFLVRHCGEADQFDNEISVSHQRKTRRKQTVELNSDPTMHELLLRLQACSKSKSDLNQFFDLADQYNFSFIVRPDFVKCSSKLLIDCFIFKTDFVGSLRLSNEEIFEQIHRHHGLIKDMVLVEDTNELILPSRIATFTRRVASLLNLLYVYDCISEFIYKVVHNL